MKKAHFCIQLVIKLKKDKKCILKNDVALVFSKKKLAKLVSVLGANCKREKYSEPDRKKRTKKNEFSLIPSCS